MHTRVYLSWYLMSPMRLLNILSSSNQLTLDSIWRWPHIGPLCILHHSVIDSISAVDSLSEFGRRALSIHYAP